MSLCVGLASCSNMSEKEIEEQMASGVVLIQNQSFYEVVLPNGNSIYFSNFDEEDGFSGLSTDVDSVEVSTSYGTGFFISDDGQIATNAHVVSNTAEQKAMNKSVSGLLSDIKSVFKAYYNEKQEELEEANQYVQYAYISPDVSAADYYAVKAYRDNLVEEINSIVDIYNAFDNMNASDADIIYHNQVSIAYNDTYVTSMNDFTSCVVKKTDPDHDLAIIQLKDKKTPADKYIFEVSDEDPLEDYSFGENITSKLSDDKNSKLFMTSFNLGPTLAITDEGAKAQFNSGTISQRTGERLMYSIPSLHGSSGSPVVNYAGQLVAVNYAGITTTQNFNYGIRVKYLKKLMDD